MSPHTDDLRINDIHPLVPHFAGSIPQTAASAEVVADGQLARIADAVHGHDDRFEVVVVVTYALFMTHQTAIEYAGLLKGRLTTWLIIIVMRVY